MELAESGLRRRRLLAQFSENTKHLAPRSESVGTWKEHVEVKLNIDIYIIYHI